MEPPPPSLALTRRGPWRWLIGGDAVQRTAASAFAVALLAVLVAGILALAGRCTEEGPSRGTARVSVDGRRGVPVSADGGYTRWPVLGTEGLLMIPAVDREGDVWFGGLGSNTLDLFQPLAGRALTFPYGVDPPAQTTGVVVDANRVAWLAQDGRHTIGRFDLELRRYTEYPTPTAQSSPFGIALAGDGRVWFTEVAAHQLGVLDPATGVITEYPLPGEEIHPYWLAAAPDGRIWFTTILTPFVGVLDPASGRVQLLTVPGLTEGQGTTGVAIGPDGSVWFGVMNGMLGRVTPDGVTITTYQSPGDTAYGVAVDRNGIVWLASTKSEVYAYLPAAARFCTVPTGPGAWWVTAGGDGSLWVAEGVRRANRLGQLSPERAAAPCS